jgi:hypothetical protein
MTGIMRAKGWNFVIIRIGLLYIFLYTFYIYIFFMTKYDYKKIVKYNYRIYIGRRENDEGTGQLVIGLFIPHSMPDTRAACLLVLLTG